MLLNKPKVFKTEPALKFPCFHIEGYLEIRLSSNSCLSILFSGSHPHISAGTWLELPVDTTTVVSLSEYLYGQQCLLKHFGEDLLGYPSALQLQSYHAYQLSLCKTSCENISPGRLCFYPALWYDKENCQEVISIVSLEQSGELYLSRDGHRTLVRSSREVTRKTSGPRSQVDLMSFLVENGKLN